MALVKLSEFKGNPMLVLAQDEKDRYPFQFGVRKASLIVEHIDDIKLFVENNKPEEPKEEDTSVTPPALESKTPLSKSEETRTTKNTKKTLKKTTTDKK